jgi:hypothetical protein
LVISLATSAHAQAACADLDECHDAATWQKALADEYYKQAFFSGADAQKNFQAAADWHNKSIGAFLSGDGDAAQWYQAVANDYARKAVASQKAADNYVAMAKAMAAAADYNFRRYISIANSPEAGDEAVASASGIGTKTLKKAKAICRRHWAGRIVCDSVVSKTLESGVRYVWKVLHGESSVCLRTKAQPGYINPSTGYVERIVHVCTKWQ